VFSDFRAPGGDIAGQVEREISNVGGVANAGDFQGVQIGFDAMKFADISGMAINPFDQLDREVEAISNFQDVNIVDDVMNEVDFLAGRIA